jgi:hypothetical protein
VQKPDILTIFSRNLQDKHKYFIDERLIPSMNRQFTLAYCDIVIWPFPHLPDSLQWTLPGG